VAEERNLELDVEGGGSSSDRLLRVCVAFARGYTSDGAAPTITRDCTDLAELEREVERLRGELDRTLEEARALLEGSEPPAPVESEARAEAAVPKPHLDSDLKVQDLMTREVRTLDRNDKLAVAEELMRLGRMRHAVVLDEDGRLAGVLSQRDIFFNALAWSLGQGRDAHRKALAACVVKEVMQTQVVTIAPDASLSDAAERMRERKLGCLPVMDGDTLVGILTEGDFLALLSKG